MFVTKKKYEALKREWFAEQERRVQAQKKIMELEERLAAVSAELPKLPARGPNGRFTRRA